MANANTPFGLKPVGSVNGTVITGAIRQFSVEASDGTALFEGDLVKLTGTSQVINGVTYTDVIRAATGDTFVGVMTGILQVTRDSTKYREASTQRVIMVDTDPNTLYEIQDISTGTPIVAADIGLNINIVVGTGSTFTGLSGTTMDNTTEATTNTLDLKIIGFVNRADNDVGASGKFLVKLNRHAYALQIAGT